MNMWSNEGSRGKKWGMGNNWGMGNDGNSSLVESCISWIDGMVLGNGRDGVSQSRLDPVSPGKPGLWDVRCPWSGNEGSCRCVCKRCSIMKMASVDGNEAGKEDQDGLHGEMWLV